jgi:hypothetical protein
VIIKDVSTAGKTSVKDMEKIIINGLGKNLGKEGRSLF